MAVSIDRLRAGALGDPGNSIGQDVADSVNALISFAETTDVTLTSLSTNKSDTSHGHSLATNNSHGFMSSADKVKLDSLVSSGTSDAYLLNRANHTGTQDISTVSGLVSALDGKAPSGHGHTDASTMASGFMSATDKAKLNSVAVNASANSSDAVLLNRANHTGAQAISTITGLSTSLASKADATHTHVVASETVAGFMSAADKAKLTGIVAGATLNSPDATLLARINHTGTQPISTVDGLQLALDAKASFTHGHTLANNTTSGFMSNTDKVKLDSVAANASANSTDAHLLSRANHTGTQAQSTVSGLEAALSGKQPMLTAGPGITIDQQTWTITSSGGGGSGTSDHAALVNRNIADQHSISSITGLTGELAAKASINHSHTDASINVSGFMSYQDKVKLESINAGATVNQSDAYLLDRANHTGTQAISTVTGLQTALDGKMATNTTLSTWATSVGNAGTGILKKTAANTYSWATVTYADVGAVSSSIAQTVAGIKTFSSRPVFSAGLQVSDISFLNSYTKKFSLSYTPAASFIAGEYQELLTLTPSSSSQNYTLDGTIYVQSSSIAQVIRFTLVVRSDTLPILLFNGQYEEDLIGSTAFVKPVIWYKDTSTSAIKLAIQSLTGTAHNISCEITVVNRGAYDNVVANTAFTSDTSSIPAGYVQSDFLKVRSTAAGFSTFTNKIVGNIDTANALFTARTITATGDADWTTSFKGDQNVTAALTLKPTGITAGTYGSGTQIPQITFDAKGRATAVTLVAPSIKTVNGASLIGAGNIDTGGAVTGLIKSNGAGGFSAAVPGTDYALPGGTATSLAAAKDIAITGDATWSVAFKGDQNVSSVLTLANSGVSIGTYRSVTVDIKGRVTAGTNPTTLAGYQISDAVALSGNQTIAGTKVFTSPIISSAGAALVARGGATEGGQIVLGYGNNLATAITGQENNTWNIDVDANNDLRFVRVGASADALLALSIDDFSGEITAHTRVRIGANLATAPFQLISRAAAPTTLVDGDMWHTGNEFYLRLNGTSRTVIHNGNPTSLASDVTQVQAETGTDTARRWFTPQRVAQAIAALAAPKTSTNDRITALENSQAGNTALARKAIAIAILGL